MMPTARRTIVWQTTHSLRGLVKQVDFSTAWGVAVLVTPLAVFTRQGEGRFVLALRRSEVSAEELRACTGFAFDESGAATAQSVTTTEREELERLDSEGVLEALFARVRSA
jgi:glutaconate CoA-transferase subunit B